MTELVEPLDYEDFLIQNATVLNRDPLKQILEFPPNDVSVKTIPKKTRTIKPIVPKEDLYVSD